MFFVLFFFVYLRICKNMDIKTNITTDLNGNIFTVSILNSKTLDSLFSYDFTVYKGFDEKGLIEDALFMYKRCTRD